MTPTSGEAMAARSHRTGPSAIPSMTPTAFVNKWRGSTRTERSASQEHFIDLCRLVGHPTPGEMDPTGETFTFEKGAAVLGGGRGWADVWKRGHFAWEYKGPRANLDGALRQVKGYRDDLENPPLLVVCDLTTFEVHTSFTNTVSQRYAFTLDDLGANVQTPTSPLPPLRVLEHVFHDPDRLKPTRTPAQVTREAAAEFAKLASSLQTRGHDPEHAARFLMRLLFCLFAEDVGLLPQSLFTRMVQETLYEPAEFREQVSELFAKMAGGGRFGPFRVPHFNGGLFADGEALVLTAADTEILRAACRLDWSSVEPAIFGALFERSLDPAKRSQLGAHYTSREDIELIVEPVLMAPLRRRWEAVQQQARDLVARRDVARDQGGRTRAENALRSLFTRFQDEIVTTRVLDPACGSGNFLYVALKRLLDLEHEVSRFAARCGLPMLQSRVGPEQLYGIEIDAYAHELAQVVVWIGYIQWLKDNGWGWPSPPILKPLDTIQRRDAILEVAEDGTVSEPSWPDAEVIIGNPPFLGDKKMRAELGAAYVETLRKLYAGRVPGGADLVTCWFEKARELIATGNARRVGLLATNSIRSHANRRVLTRIKESGAIFMAWSDRSWIVDGAQVRVAMVGFDDGSETAKSLDGKPVETVSADLRSSGDLTVSRSLIENAHLCLIGDQKGGMFDITPEMAVAMLAAPMNPNSRPNSDVVRPWVNGLDIVRRPRGMWIIDFGINMPESGAALYEMPFAHVLRYVKSERMKNNRAAYRERWWIHHEPRPKLRSLISHLHRYIVTPTVSRHRVFAWVDRPTLPDKQLAVIARDDDYFMGALQSRVHDLWTLQMCSWLGVGNDPRYTPTSTFETFPFPWPPGQEPTGDPRVVAIAEAARELNERRERWLNPEGASPDERKKRTLTSLYNARPTWLQLLHQQLDHAVMDAYGWPHDLADAGILERLLALNLARPSA